MACWSMPSDLEKEISWHVRYTTTTSRLPGPLDTSALSNSGATLAALGHFFRPTEIRKDLQAISEQHQARFGPTIRMVYIHLIWMVASRAVTRR